MKTLVSGISVEKLKAWRKEYDSDVKNTILRHALSHTNLKDVVYKGDNQSEQNMVYSIELKTMPVCNQKATGRCWIFAGLNLLREILAKKLNIDSFELSQNYIAFYNKLEKFNYVISELETLLDRPHDDRVIADLLHQGIPDGGQWGMFISIVKKYGICPKSVYGETFQSSASAESNRLLNSLLRSYASKIFRLHAEHKDKEISELHDQYVKKVYSILLSSYGVPPTEFAFEYRNSKGEFVRDEKLSPIEFFKKYFGDSLDDYVSVIHAPTKDKKYNELYTIEHLGNIAGEVNIRHLNLPMSRIKELVVTTLKDGEPVWFGSDVSHYGEREKGHFDDQSFDYESAFGVKLDFDKAEMLDFYESSMTHAMLITGVNLDDKGNPTRYKIENSWGPDRADKGYYLMSDSYFGKFAYQVVINRKYFTKEEREASQKDPVVLPLWDPYGTLAD